jgi:hypothetical protein
MLVPTYEYLSDEDNKHDLFEQDIVIAHTVSSFVAAFSNMLGTNRLAFL